MSSTNRKNNKREKSDYYVTPIDCIKLFLYEWIKDEDIGITKNTRFLDCSAGGDSKHGMSYADVITEEFGTSPMTIDIRPDSKAEIIADYLTYNIPNPKPDIIISNPPFFLAQEFITKALADVVPDGYVIMLLRLNFLESKARKLFFTDNMPERIYVHHKRMSFTDDNKTDSIAYAHFVWHKGQKLSKSILKII